MSTKRKLKCLTLGEKLEVIKKLKSGMKKKEISSLYSLPLSSLSTIIKNQSVIMKKCETTHNLSSKRYRKPGCPQFERSLVEWVQKYNSNNAIITGPVLREQAIALSKSLGYNTFRASNGWLQLFKKRNAALFRQRREYKKKLEKLQDSTTQENSVAESSDILSPEDKSENKSSSDTVKMEFLSYDEENSNQSDDIQKLKEVEVFSENNESTQEDIPVSNPLDLNKAEDENRTTQNPKVDHYEAFGAYIATLLRMLPPKKALMLQPKIANFIISAGLEEPK